MTRVAARAPSNIALIKYMGKSDSAANLPANASLSMTLDSLRSVAEVERVAGGSGCAWIPELPQAGASAGFGEGGYELPPQAPQVPALSESGVSRIIRHVERIRAAAPGILAQAGLRADCAGRFALRTSNTFPASAGIASSASSFAAVTLASLAACAADLAGFRKAYSSSVPLRRSLARLSREGSGSSCRSFEGPWVLWDRENAAAVPAAAMPELTDLVVLVGTAPKDVSSSEAHARVSSSPLWPGRVERATRRIESLARALKAGDLPAVGEIAWAELWEMHSLFHTAREPFTYWEPGSVAVLKWIVPWIRSGTGRADLECLPIVTMDAGPNVHVLVPTREHEKWLARIRASFPELRVLVDHQGRGAEIL